MIRLSTDARHPISFNREIHERYYPFVTFACNLFLSNAYSKLYFDFPKRSAYRKDSQLPDAFLRANHSIRRLNESDFLLESYRKCKENIVGKGTYKIVKLCYLISIQPAGQVQIKRAIIAKDLRSKSAFPVRRCFEDLRDLSYIECVTKITHQTSEGKFKQFHYSKEARCNALNISRMTPALNFNEVVTICEQVIRGIIELRDLGYAFGDLKASNILVYTKLNTKHCDLDSIGRVGTISVEQTAEYLAPRERYSFLKDYIKSKSRLHFIDYYHKNPRTILSIENTTASAGIVIANILLESSVMATFSQVSEFWRIVNGLVGDFDLSHSLKTITNIIKKIESHLPPLDSEADFPPALLPTMTLDHAQARLLALSLRGTPAEINMISAPLTMEGFLSICKQITLEIDALHKAGILHGNFTSKQIAIFNSELPDDPLKATLKPFSCNVADGSLTKKASFLSLSPRLQYQIRSKVLVTTYDSSFKNIIYQYRERSELQSVVMTKEDETISVGIALLDIAIQKGLLKEPTPEHLVERFLLIISDLTGGLILTPLANTSKELYEAVYDQASLIGALKAPFPAPLINLEQAAIAFETFLSAS